MTGPLPPLDLPRIGLGCSRTGSFNNPQTFAESRALFRLAMDLGVTLFDTANIYGQGDSERVLGQALRGMRNRATIVTKAGNTFSARMRLLRPFKPLLRPLLAREGNANAVTSQRGGAMRSDWTTGALIDSLAGSLRRLGTDRVDIFLLHSPPAEILAGSDAPMALEKALASGMARAVGVAVDDIAALDAALDLPQVTALEVPWDVLDAIRETPRAALLQARGIAVIAREVLTLQTGVPPLDAIGHAASLPFVTTTLIGTRQGDRLRAAAARFIVPSIAPGPADARSIA